MSTDGYNGSMSGKLSIWLKQGALVVASLLVALLLIEGMLRILGWSHPVFARPDHDLGWSFRPGISGWSRHENTAYLQMNRYGFRGTNWPQQSQQGVVRIAMLGDSFLDSSNLADRDELTRVVERELKTCPALAGRSPEVLNFGVSGYGTGQQYRLLKERVAPFRPDLVVLAFYAGNDVPNNSRALSVEGQKSKPYFKETRSGELTLDNSFRDSFAFRKELASDWQRRLINNSYLLQALKQVVSGHPAVPSPLAFDNSSKGVPRNLFGPEFDALFSPPLNETWRSAWSVTEKLLLQMRDWSRKQGTGFGVVVIPDPIQVAPGSDWRSAIARKIKSDDLDYPVRRIVQFAARNDIPVRSLLDPLRAVDDRDNVFLYGFPPKLARGHMNAAGNAVAGREIGNWLCERFMDKK